MKIYVATEKHFHEHFGPDLVLPHNALCFTVKQTDTISSLKDLIQPFLGVPSHHLRIWDFVRRHNQTVRPDGLMSDDKPINSAYSFSSIAKIQLKPMDNIFFAEISDVGLNDVVKKPDMDPKDMVLLFIKYYQPEKPQICYIGKVYVNSSTILNEIVPHLRMMAGLRENVPIMVYEEIKKDRQNKIDLNHDLKKEQLQNGDILIIQEYTPRVYDFPYPTIPDYFRYLCMMKMVVFQPLESQGKYQTFQEEFNIEKVNYQDIREIIAKHLEVPPDHILVQGKQWKPCLVGDTDNKTLLKDMIQVKGEWDMVLRYEIYDFSVGRLPDLIMFNIRWLDTCNEPTPTYCKVYVEKKNPRAGEAIAQFLEKWKVEPKKKVLEYYRILAIKDNKIKKVYLASDKLPKPPLQSQLHDYFVEEIPEDEKPTIKAKVQYNGENEILKLTISNMSDLQEQIKNKLNIIGKFRIEYLDKDFGVFSKLHEITELKDLVVLQISPEKENNIDSQHQGSTKVLQERGNRREPPTARITPGKRFLEIIANVLATPMSVIDGLEKHASEQLPLIIIQNFKDKIEDFSETNAPECAFSLALCWLYTTDTWVYSHVNTLLRDDSSTMVALAPFMKALIESYKNLEGDNRNFHEGVVYRRTKLTPKGLEFYKPNLHFVWSAFTSTTIEFNPSGEFGSILFEITIPKLFKKYALCLENISAFPTEREVLMLPNIGYKVVSIENNPHQYPNTTCVIKLSIEYVCLVV